MISSQVQDDKHASLPNYHSWPRRLLASLVIVTFLTSCVTDPVHQAALKKVKEGQLVYVFTKDKWYSYKIDTIKEVLPTQTEVIAPTDTAVLTLYTCSGFSDSKRLIVQAKRVES